MKHINCNFTENILFALKKQSGCFSEWPKIIG